MAGVMPIRRSSAAAMSHSQSPNTAGVFPAAGFLGRRFARDVKLADRVVADRIGFGRREALALLGDHVQELAGP